MNLSESFRTSLAEILSHKLRSTLTLFGLVWGTASVIFLVGWGVYWWWTMARRPRRARVVKAAK